jgi:hypothetical protein
LATNYGHLRQIRVKVEADRPPRPVTRWRSQDLLLHTDCEPHSPTEWEQWHRTTRKAVTKQYVTTSGNQATPDGTRLVHSHCQRRETGASKREPALLYA